jgi:hypothetical protein
MINEPMTLNELDELADLMPANGTTDRLTRRQMVMTLLQATDTPEEAPQPQPDVPLDVAPAKPAIRPPVAPRMARAWLWLIAQVQTPYRTKRAIIALLKAPVKAWSFLRVITSPQVDAETKAARDAACSECPFRHYRLRRTKGGVVLDEHCGKCGCPDWKYSRNEVRNWYSAWLCPVRRHEGAYPDDDLRESLKGRGYDPEIVFGGGGCTGCGCGKAGAGK